MQTYLVGLQYHEPESYALWKNGVVEDYESSTGIFVKAKSEGEALAWGMEVANAVLRAANNDSGLSAGTFGYECWIEHNPEKSDWQHCLSFFQEVAVGELPNIEKMSAFAYSVWCKENGIEY
ncbi:hypothetical protein SAMN05216229_1372 [Geopseudomonas sagittaria]|uniref:Uncharacterized protein n=1 Tax=Geopseudomonas sagittaria TaxID=1135990 RepID=A0A1I5ZD58_9GAMM|nr:hypothetical protein [Pseudomonas sagittaria]SFQ54381.1 hypothetical protein SAMN05216229_1372 [Pseudomonas sagittaria]